MLKLRFNSDLNTLLGALDATVYGVQIVNYRFFRKAGGSAR